MLSTTVRSISVTRTFPIVFTPSLVLETIRLYCFPSNSKSLNLLCEKGYATAEKSSEKKYKIKYFITKSGVEVYKSLNTRIEDVVKKSGASLSDEERCIFLW